MNETQPRGGGLAAAGVRLTGVWILAGALGKLFLGTPKLLPQPVIDLRPEAWSLTFTFQFVIAVELCLAGLAFLKPRLAWPVLVGLLVFFDLILTRTIQAGAESCGCFGGSIKVSPWLMLGVDSFFLVALLATAPWKRIRRRGAPIPWLIPVAIVAVLAPWLKIHAGVTGRPAPSDGAVAAGPRAPAGTPPGMTPGTATGDPAGAGDPVSPADPDPPASGAAASEKLDWLELQPAKWVGQLVYDVPDLTRYVDPGLLPSDGRIVLWRQGCSHCAAHLREMAEHDDETVPILMVQIEDDLEDGRAVDLMPQGSHVTHAHYPEGLEIILQTPWELTTEGGTITSAVGPDGLEQKDEPEKK
jgi:Methylamine utilisation protein MauE